MTALLLEFWPYIAGLAALAFGALKVYGAGRQKERDKQLREELKARDIRDAVDNDVGAMTPEQRKEALKKW